ncbi:MAG: hypothetical protein NWF12_08650 [Candidatus Bathyarchaeota archaeon]|nr:hypothetical protein [Candidatus Bathyarchaeota archaeon]
MPRKHPPIAVIHHEERRDPWRRLRRRPGIRVLGIARRSPVGR